MKGPPSSSSWVGLFASRPLGFEGRQPHATLRHGMFALVRIGRPGPREQRREQRPGTIVLSRIA